jgi:hypothetical protein
MVIPLPVPIGGRPFRLVELPAEQGRYWFDKGWRSGSLLPEPISAAKAYEKHLSPHFVDGVRFCTALFGAAGWNALVVF